MAAGVVVGVDDQKERVRLRNGAKSEEAIFAVLICWWWCLFNMRNQEEEG